MLYDKDDRVPRVEWLREFGVNDRQEKRARALGLPWPPHVTLGRRVFYFAAAHAGVVHRAGGQEPGVG